MHSLALRAATKKDYRFLKDRILHDFPISERIPFFLLKRSLNNGRLNASIILKGEDLAGYIIYDDTYSDFVYVHYLAISPEFRGEGFGTQMFGLFIDKMKPRGVMLEVEDPRFTTEHEEVLTQTNRIKFYENLQMRLVEGVSISMMGQCMRIMLSADMKDRDDYAEIYDQMYSAVVGKQIARKAIKVNYDEE